MARSHHFDRSSYRFLTALALVGVLGLSSFLMYRNGGIDASSNPNVCPVPNINREVIANVDFRKTTGSFVTAGVTLADEAGIEITTLSTNNKSTRAIFTHPFKTGVSYQLFARGSDTSQSEIVSFSLAADEGKVGYGKEVNLTLEPTYQLSGTAIFIDQNGRKVSDVPKGTILAKGTATSTPPSYEATIAAGKFNGLRLMQNREYKVTANSVDGKSSDTQTVTLSKDESREFRITTNTTVTSGNISGTISGGPTPGNYTVQFIPVDKATGLSSKSISSTANSYVTTLDPGRWYVKARSLSHASSWREISVEAGTQAKQDLAVSPLTTSTFTVRYSGKTLTIGSLPVYQPDLASQERIELAAGLMTFGGNLALAEGSYTAYGTLVVNGQAKKVRGSFSVSSKNKRVTVNLTDAQKTGLENIVRPIVSSLFSWVGKAQAQVPNCGRIEGFVTTNYTLKPRSKNEGLNEVTVKLTKIVNGKDGKVYKTTTRSHPDSGSSGAGDGYYEFNNLPQENATYRLEAVAGTAKYLDDTKRDYVNGNTQSIAESKFTFSYSSAVNELKVKQLKLKFTSNAKEDPYFQVKPTWQTDSETLGKAEQAQGNKYYSTKDRVIINCTYDLVNAKASGPQLCSTGLIDPGAPVAGLLEHYEEAVKEMVSKGEKEINIVVAMTLESESIGEYLYYKADAPRPRAENFLDDSSRSIPYAKRNKGDGIGKYKLLLKPVFNICVGAVNNFKEGKQLTIGPGNIATRETIGFKKQEAMIFKREASISGNKAEIISVSLKDLLDMYSSTPAQKPNRRIFPIPNSPFFGADLSYCDTHRPQQARFTLEHDEEAVNFLFP